MARTEFSLCSPKFLGMLTLRNAIEKGFLSPKSPANLAFLSSAFFRSSMGSIINTWHISQSVVFRDPIKLKTQSPTDSGHFHLVCSAAAGILLNSHYILAQ